MGPRFLDMSAPYNAKLIALAEDVALKGGIRTWRGVLIGAGIAIVVAVQAFINMGVAVSLLPAKGMTLPFISSGGSSLFAVALTMGFALALIRHRPQIAAREQKLFGFLKGARA